MFRDRIECVTVSVGYADFLRQSAPHNLIHFDRWVVVTTPEDKATQHVCREFRIHCVVTDDATRDGPFSKGRLIERGLQHLSADTWVLHLDADIVLPSDFRKTLHRCHLDPKKIYGVDRFLIKGWEQWQKLLHSGWLRNPHDSSPFAVKLPNGYPLMARWAGPDGWCAIGFFQLWNRLGGGEEVWGSRMKPYSMFHGNACRGDVQHSHSWDRRHRELLGELFVGHLESEGGHKNGANWNGRTTPYFGPKEHCKKPCSPS